MFSVKSSKKLSSGVLLSSLISVMQSSVGFSVESNVKEENKGAVEINIEKDDVKAENTKSRRVLEVVKENKNIILPVAVAALLVPPALYGAKKVYDSRYKEPLNVIVSSGEKSNSVNEPGKSVVEGEILQNDLGKEDISDKNLNLPGKDPASEDPLRNDLPTGDSHPKSKLDIEDSQNKEENGQGSNGSVQDDLSKSNVSSREISDCQSDDQKNEQEGAPSKNDAVEKSNLWGWVKKILFIFFICLIIRLFSRLVVAIILAAIYKLKGEDKVLDRANKALEDFISKVEGKNNKFLNFAVYIVFG